MDNRLKNSFDYDTEGWQVYDYAKSIEAGRDVYWSVTWKETGGVNNSGYIWADDSRWTIDTPEHPRSILALIIWRPWVLRGAVDMRDGKISVYLRGDDLDLKGADCLFWVFSRKYGTRWHYRGNPLPIARGRWPDRPITFTLKNDESLWHRSWAIHCPNYGSLDEVLAQCDSYGFSFVGFSEKVTGKFAMDEFEIKPVTS